MWYPQNGSMANGSRRSLPTAPAAAAVVSDAMIEPRNTPWSQSNASVTRGNTAMTDDGGRVVKACPTSP